jgi:methyltransferase-like protein 23
MDLPLNLHTIEIGSIRIEMYLPDPESVRKKYDAEKIGDTENPFPFWAKIWPSAFALAKYLNENPDIIKGKKVLELAGGLGLPSLIASHYAKKVCCSDYLEEAVAVVRQSVLHNGINNMDCRVYNWYSLPEELPADVLLLSDVNYEPAVFDQLIKVCEKFLQQGTRIILATPGRIMAKDFVDRLDKWNIEKTEMNVDSENPVYVFLLKQ